MTWVRIELSQSGENACPGPRSSHSQITINESIIIMGGQYEDCCSERPKEFSISGEETLGSQLLYDEEEEEKRGRFMELGAKDGGPTEEEIVHRYPMNEMWVLERDESLENYLEHCNLKSQARKRKRDFMDKPRS